jgi:hypothetical protein
MASTLSVNIHIVNATDRELTFTNFWCDAGDWETAPKFPERLAPSTVQVIAAEAYYYRKTVPFSIDVGCNGASFGIVKYDPYHDSLTVTQQQTDGLQLTTVVGPSASTGRYDVLILVAGTRYP